MDFSKKLSKIESHEFAADLCLASDYKIYLRILKEHKAVQDLLEALGYNKNKSKLIQRIIDLSNQVIDTRYENPWDVALSAYLWILSQKDMKLAQLAAEVAAKAPNCWWTIRISQDVVQNVLLTDSSTSSLEWESGLLEYRSPNIVIGERLLTFSFISESIDEIPDEYDVKATILDASPLYGPKEDTVFVDTIASEVSTNSDLKGNNLYG